MFCKYCGKQLDDDSVFCSGCGKKLSVPAQPVTPVKPASPVQPGMRKLVLRRKKCFPGCAVSLGILIDGVEKTRIKNGEEITLMISTDAHTMNIRQDNFGGKFTSKTFVISAGGNAYGYVEPTITKGKWNVTFEYM